MLANSLAESGAFVRFIGFGDTRAVPGGCAGIEWLAVPGSKRGKAFAACSSLPVAAAIDATNAYRLLLDTQLRERWDAVVLDGYGTGWALGRCVSYRDGSRAHRPVLVHVSHNHEELLWCALAREARGSTVTRYTLRRNASKVSALERRIVRNADLVTTITDEDRQTLGTDLDQDRMLTLTPGYVGWVADGRLISAATPRRVIIMGSFQWVVKQENLARFVEIADPIFQQHGIALDVVGDVPRELLRRLQARCRSTCFHGFVADVAPLLARARIGVVPESIGGGFKLKFLDYIFGRVPVATVSQAAAGLPEELRCTMLSNSSLEGVVEDIVSHIDRPGHAQPDAGAGICSRESAIQMECKRRGASAGIGSRTATVGAYAGEIHGRCRTDQTRTRVPQSEVRRRFGEGKPCRAILFRDPIRFRIVSKTGERGSARAARARVRLRNG